MTLRCDIHEPPEALTLIAPSVPCEQVSLNTDGFADYCWNDLDGRLVQVERKQWGEVLSGIDKVEDQLRRHLKGHPEARLILLLEGTSIPSQLGTTILKATNRDSIWVKGYSSSVRTSQVYAWLYGISRYIELYQTSTYEATCTALVSFYKYDQKEAHNTFTRHFKAMTFNPNPQVIQLMGMMPGIGEKRAGAIIAKFSTIYNVITASPAELATVDGIGPVLSVSLLQRCGRFDV